MKKLKTIGLLGGMSWESSTHYYQLLNQKIAARLGELHSAPIVMVSVDFQPLETMMRNGEWDRISMRLCTEAKRIEAAGADLLLLCTNTMHKLAGQISSSISIPFLHIADATGRKIQKEGLQTVGLLGTRFTMEERFYRSRLENNFQLKVLIPDTEEMKRVDEIIFSELCRGVVKESSQNEYLQIIDNLQARGAQGIIAGCTEIGMLIEQKQLSLPLLDTMQIHVDEAVEAALQNS